MTPIAETGPMVIKVFYADLAAKKIAEFTSGDNTYTVSEYEHKGNKVYDVICDDTVELRIILIG
jgi:hypothetical protein